MSELLYRRLLAAFNEDRFFSTENDELIGQLGAPAAVLRGCALVRRRAWASAAADFSAALARPGVAAIVELVAGFGLFACRRYHEGLEALARAAAHGKPGVAAQARRLGHELASRLAWHEEVRSFSAGSPADRAALCERLADAIDQGPAQVDATVARLVVAEGPVLVAELLEELAIQRPLQRLRWLPAQVRLDLVLGRLERARTRLEGCSAAELEELVPTRTLLARAGEDAKAVIVRSAHRSEVQLLYLRAWAVGRQGALSEAMELLEQARASAPDSVHLQLALAGINHRMAVDAFDESIERRFEILLEWAPGLLADAARLAGLELWTDIGPISDRALMVQIFTRAEALLSLDFDLERPSYRVGYRVGYRAEGALRNLAAGPGEQGRFESLHGDDTSQIARLESVLVRALGVRPPEPRKPNGTAIHGVGARGKPAPQRPPTLSAEQIEQFMSDGYLRIEGAFDATWARRWREQATTRIREEPERWVRGYEAQDSQDPTRSLREFDPREPRTWTWPRIEVRGPETIDIATSSPRGWGAICDLLGGAERIKTKQWHNYLILNLCADAELGITRPAPHWQSWHIDDPNPMTRLDNIRNGLIGIVLFDDLLPGSGNTWLCPDSLPRVARELAAHPEGVDFCSRRGGWLTQRCQRFVEVVGGIGDLVLMHPLLMHSSAPNPSGRIRWMGNPMVYMNEALDPHRPAARRSPVEEAIWRSLRS